jgi:hypothetical protein
MFSFWSKNPHVLSLDEEYHRSTKGSAYFFEHVDPSRAFKKYLDNLGELLLQKKSSASKEEKKDYHVLLTNALKIYQIDSTFVNNDLRKRTIVQKENLDLVEALDVVLDNAPTTAHAFKCYKCYKNNVTPEQIESWPSNGSYLSTSLSQEFAEKWCVGGNYKKLPVKRQFFKSRTAGYPSVGLVICIIVPENSKGVVPMFVEHFENFKQNEIVLHRKGKLINTNYLDNNGYPIFIYSFGDELNVQIDQYRDLFTEPPTLNRSQMSSRSTQVHAIGGKTRKKRRLNLK